jgi:hypothetical protein
MRGLDPRIHHIKIFCRKQMDCRVKPGNDGFDYFERPQSTFSLG